MRLFNIRPILCYSDWPVGLRKILCFMQRFFLKGKRLAEPVLGESNLKNEAAEPSYGVADMVIINYAKMKKT